MLSIYRINNLMIKNKNPLGEDFSAGQNVAVRIASLLPNSDMKFEFSEAVNAKFKSGQGVLVLHPNLSDKTIALMIKKSIKAADGKAFSVIGPANDN